MTNTKFGQMHAVSGGMQAATCSGRGGGVTRPEAPHSLVTVQEKEWSTFQASWSAGLCLRRSFLPAPTIVTQLQALTPDHVLIMYTKCRGSVEVLRGGGNCLDVAHSFINHATKLFPCSSVA